ncbi:MAG: hypothetical protein FJ087_23670 [Deltaproteobacteria bacterium]|nr:hypothetical protein [Deltaproteobacteria bacterium]
MNPRMLAAPAAALVATAWAAGTRAQEVTASASVGHEWTDNVYLTRTREADNAIVPGLDAGLGFAGYWTAEYEGAAELYAEHTDLTSHNHTLRLVANPAWGPDGETELLVALAAETLRNQDAFSMLNFVGARLTTAVTLEPAPWVAWQAGADVRYRHFYDDPQSDGLDVMPRT